MKLCNSIGDSYNKYSNSTNGFHSVCRWIPVVLVKFTGGRKRVKCMALESANLSLNPDFTVDP